MSLNKLIMKSDYLGINPKFSYSNKNRYSTIPGGLISLILFILFVAHFFYSSQDIYKRINPTLLQQRISNSNATRLNLTPENFPFFIALQDPTNSQNYYMDETVFYYKPYMRIQVRSLDRNGLIVINNTKLPILLEPCDIKYHFPGLEKEFNTTSYNKAFCIGKNQNLSIFGQFQNINFDLLNIDFYQCINNTLSNIICKSQDEIDKKLKSAYVTIGLSEYLNQPHNISFPLNRIKQEYFTTFSNYGMKEINVFIKRIFYNTDVGLIFEDNYFQECTQIDNINELYTSSISKLGDKFMRLGVRMSINEDYYFRRYRRIQDVIASTGGLIKFFFLISIYGIDLLTKNIYLLDLVIDKFKSVEIESKITKSSNINYENKNIEINSSIANLKTHNLKITSNKLGICNYIKLFYCKKKTIEEQSKYLFYKKIINLSEKFLDVNNYIISLLDLRN